MEIILLLGYVPIVAYLFWQSYLLNQYKKIVDNQKDVIVNLSKANDRLRPFQFSQSLPFGVAVVVGSQL